MSKVDLYKGEDTICILCDFDCKTCGEAQYLDEAIDEIACRKFKLTKIKTQKRSTEIEYEADLNDT